ncbi:class I SAM-dependent methyltransferase [Stieleria marina]|uniref:Bifunctional 3-demethylubiquinone-9 3-methyltransferase/ 2-octaprenyl-6-hydroxy phenol methylase n=1 Tax=Stieleria marina TaxID=1930275 RepID=A0A517NN85_9BACT|nr:bifunctional 3-demethylubiquinone-9 3-methyltransferase/ 2-octaprenyl-6-hydroxy phenol methylase [Planctomycetes bacterium K23_9]
MAEPSLPTGMQTMSPAMAEMRAYPRYLYDQVAGCFGDRVWEIGVGYGTYTTWLREANKSVLATDIDAECLNAVAKRFAGDDQVTTAIVDLTDESTVKVQRKYLADSILCLNVLEHIQDDVQALMWIRENVAANAVMGLIVPAHQALFGRMDAEAGHFRRYTRKSLTSVFQQAGWQVDQTRYLNLLGAAGWWYHNRLRKDAGLNDRSVNHQMRGADRWLPRIASVTDPLTGWLAGLSVLAIARVK